MDKNNSLMVNHGFPKDDEIGVNSVKVRYIQRNDTCADDENVQQIHFETISTLFSPNDNTDSFIRLSIGKSSPDDLDVEDFWSINGLEDLIEIFNDFERRRGSNIHYKLTKVVTPKGKQPIITEYE